MNADSENISLEISHQPFGYSVVSPELTTLCLMESDAERLVKRLFPELRTLYLIEQRRRVDFEVFETADGGVIPVKIRVRDNR
jgi:hypothetical protein